MRAPHETVPLQMVDTSDQFVTLVDTLARQDLIAIDTESNSLHAYQEQVCLIQVSTRERDFVVDTLALDNIALLGDIIANPAIEKIFHAAEYDVMCLRRDYDFAFSNLFDTLAAVRILGWKKVGLASILADKFDVRLSKRHQKADWGRRPLSREMLRYAQADTHYLPTLRDDLLQLLADGGYLDEAREIFAELERLGPHPGNHDPDGFWGVRGAFDLAPKERAVLREVWRYRENMAQKNDKPPFKIVGDLALSELATEHPTHLSDLDHLENLHPGQIRRFGHGLLRAVKRGLHASPPKPPRRPPRPDDDLLALYDTLLNWRKKRARARGVESDIIMAKETLWKLAKDCPQTTAELADMDALGPWRLQTYGSELLDILNNHNGSH